MIRVHVLVEGQTEEAFLGRVVGPHLQAFGVFVTSKVVVTKRLASGPDRKGGVASWVQIERDIRLLLNDSAVAAVTTLIDYYGLPVDVPGMRTRPLGPPGGKVAHVQAAIDLQIGDARFRPYLSMHEFEALLYADPQTCGRYLNAASVTQAMVAAVSQCGGPELVNDDPNTAPSKRLMSACPTFQKTLDGPALAELIGLASIRSACPQFDGWMSWLESLGS